MTGPLRILKQPGVFSRSLLTGLLMLSGVTAVSPANAQGAGKLASYLPNDINAVAVVRVKETLATPRAVQENWADTVEANFLKGSGGVPTWIDTLVVGFLVRPASAEQVWATGVATIPQNITIESLSKIAHSPVQYVADYPAIQGPGNALVVGLSPGLIGIRRPAVRQETARWAELIRLDKTGHLTPFLKEATEERGQIIFAIDLRHAFDRDRVRPYLDSGALDAFSKEQRDQLATLIAGIQDTTLSIEITDKVTARVIFEFSEDPSELAPAIQLAFIDILDHAGLSIDDFTQGTIQTSGKFATLTTNFSDSSLQRVLSLITVSPDTHHASGIVAGSGNSANPPSGLQVDRAYFQAIDKILNDLERSSRRSNDAARVAVWHDNFARKIDELPTQGVSEELLKFGASVSSKLRALSRSLQGQMINVNAEQGTLTYDMQFNPGWASMNVWGGIGYGQPSYQITSNLQQVRQRQAAAIAAGSEQRIQIWGMITDERGAVLRDLVNKYGTDFTETNSRRQ